MVCTSRKEVIKVDGGSVVLCNQLRVQVRPGKNMRLVFRLNADNMPETQMAWPYDGDEVDALQVYVNGVSWLIVPGIPVGLPVAVWKNTAWDEDLVDIKKFVSGEWTEIDEHDWGKLNVRKT